jgi:F-type H+-transporting ATPase subunit b
VLAFQIGPWAIEYPDRIWALVLGAALIVFILWRYNIPSFSYTHYKTHLTDRATRIAEAHQQVERTLEDMRNLRADYASRLARIETETREHIDAAVREAEAARAEIISDAKQAAQTVLRRAEEELARERTRQLIQFRRQVVQITLDAVEEAIRNDKSDTVQRELIREFIGKAARNGANGTGVTHAQPPTLAAAANAPETPKAGGV